MIELAYGLTVLGRQIKPLIAQLYQLAIKFDERLVFDGASLCCAQQQLPRWPRSGFFSAACSCFGAGLDLNNVNKHQQSEG